MHPLPTPAVQDACSNRVIGSDVADDGNAQDTLNGRTQNNDGGTLALGSCDCSGLGPNLVKAAKPKSSRIVPECSADDHVIVNAQCVAHHKPSAVDI